MSVGAGIIPLQQNERKTIPAMGRVGFTMATRILMTLSLVYVIPKA